MQASCFEHTGSLCLWKYINGHTDHDCGMAQRLQKSTSRVPNYEKVRSSGFGFSVVSGSDECLSPSGRSCWEHLRPGQCLRGPGMPAGETLPHGTVGSRPDAAAPSHRAQHSGELPPWTGTGSLLNPSLSNCPYRECPSVGSATDSPGNPDCRE